MKCEEGDAISIDAALIFICRSSDNLLIAWNSGTLVCAVFFVPYRRLVRYTRKETKASSGTRMCSWK